MRNGKQYRPQASQDNQRNDTYISSGGKATSNEKNDKDYPLPHFSTHQRNQVDD